MCQENVSVINGAGFVLLIVASLLCTLSFSAPFWIYYPTRSGVSEVARRFDSIQTQMRYPFKRASWRGLWAVCFKEVTNNTLDHVSDRPLCAWFWQKDFSSWKTIPDWYLAAEGVFTGAVLLLLLAIVVETLFACCHCCLRKSCAPTTLASLIIAAALMCATSLALFGGYALKTDEITPEPSGQAGRFDWAFFVGIGGAVVALISAVLFYRDGCRLAKIYHSYHYQATVTVS